MKAKLLLTIAIGVLGLLSHAQQINPPPPNRVGIHTRQASETLDVNGTTRVRILPQGGYAYNQNIYNGQPSRTTPFEPIYQVVANKDGVLGVVPLSVNKLVIFPRLYLPLELRRKRFYEPYYNYEPRYLSEKNGDIVMNLTKYGIGQLANLSGSPAYGRGPGSVKNPSANGNNTFGFGSGSYSSSFNADKMYFYVLYYDTDVYTDVRITEESDEQFLTYKVKPGAKATSKTYMNIVMVPAS
ncbi:MAG: hypothetical protein Q4A44_01325 [Bacteroidales bacterium]|nr:hypothetical protein [Bacteroidales bacterium]